MNVHRRPIAALGALLAAACSSSGAAPTDDAGGPAAGICLTCQDAADEPSDLVQVTGILESVCGNPDGCHGSGAGNLAISGNVFANLIRVPSSEVPTLFRVSPGDPAQSYVFLKLACEGGITGNCMPLGGHLPPSTVQAFHDWIEAGAPTQ